MSFIGQPTANLHSPGVIGDVTASPRIYAERVDIGRLVAGNYIAINPDSGGLEMNRTNAELAFCPGDPTQTGPDVKISSPAVGKMACDGNFKVNTFGITAIPTSASGLSSGDVYSNAGILTIVP